MFMQRAIFLDRDGTINEEYKDGGLDDIKLAKLLPNTSDAFKELSKLDYKVFIITNQVCVSEGRLTLAEFHKINNKIISFLKPYDTSITKTYVCPHGTDKNCKCHKPNPGMLLSAATEYDIDLSNSYMIGDRLTDVQAGLNAGTKTILVETGIGLGWLPSVNPHYKTKNLLEAVRYISKNYP